MLGRRVERAQLFYEFSLERHVPLDHLLRRIDQALDLSWLRAELTPCRRSPPYSRAVRHIGHLCASK